MTARKECGPRIIWTEENVAELRRRFADGETDATIAGALRGTRSAAQVQRSKLGLLREVGGAIAETRRRHLDAARKTPRHRLAAALAEMGRRIEASGRRFEDVRFRRVA